MAEAGVSSEEYNRFLQVNFIIIICFRFQQNKITNVFTQEPSSNVDDSGYFSVQVISEALSVWGLELIPYNSSDPRAAVTRQCPM
jgi:ataxin-3